MPETDELTGPDKARSTHETLRRQLRPLLVLRAVCCGLAVFLIVFFFSIAIRPVAFGLKDFCMSFIGLGLLPGCIVGIVVLTIAIGRRRDKQEELVLCGVPEDAQEAFDGLAEVKERTAARLTIGWLMLIPALALSIVTLALPSGTPVWQLALLSAGAGLCVFLCLLLVQATRHARRDMYIRAGSAAKDAYAGAVREILGPDADFRYEPAEAHDVGPGPYGAGRDETYRNAISVVCGRRTVAMCDARITHEIGDDHVAVDLIGILVELTTRCPFDRRGEFRCVRGTARRQARAGKALEDLPRVLVSTHRATEYVSDSPADFFTPDMIRALVSIPIDRISVNSSGYICFGVRKRELFPRQMKDLDANIRHFRETMALLRPAVDALMTLVDPIESLSKE